MSQSNITIQTIVDIIIRLGFLLALIAWCFQILSPFLSPVLWGMLIAVVLHPVYISLTGRLGGRRKLSATLITMLMLAVILVPSYFFVGSLVSGIRDIGTQMENNEFRVPPPTENVKDWPLIGEKTYDAWFLASDNLDEALERYEEQIASFGKTILNSMVGTGLGILQFVLSIIIAGILLATSEQGGRFAKSFFRKIVGVRGDEFAEITNVTIKNVAKGILGVAFIQSILAGIGFILAGVPYAGLWTLLCLILAIIQLGPGLVIIPVIIFLYSTATPLVATLWTVYLVIVMLSDNFLKPILLGKGAPVPMLVIFLGAIGGFITSGFVGLFIGAIILSLGYKLFVAWLEEGKAVDDVKGVDKGEGESLVV